MLIFSFSSFFSMPMSAYWSTSARSRAMWRASRGQHSAGTRHRVLWHIKVSKCHVHSIPCYVQLFWESRFRRLFQRFAKRAIWWRFSQKSPDFLANLIVTAARSPGRADPPFLDMELLGSVPPAGLQMAKIPNYFGFTKRYFWTPQKSRHFWCIQFWLNVNQSWKCINFL